MRREKPKFILPRGRKNPLETFDEMADGQVTSFPLGTGWNGEGLIVQPYESQIATEDFEELNTGAVTGPDIDGGAGWNGAATLYSY